MSRLVRIGLFVVITGVVFTIYVMRTIESVGGGGSSYTVTAYVDDASGLVVDAAVSLAGVTVGRVTGIDLVDGRARLTIEMRGDVELSEDAEIAKMSTSILGTSSLSVFPGSGQGGMIGDGDVLRNIRASASISDAVGTANNLAGEAAVLVEQVNRFLGDEGTIAALSEIVAVVRQTAVSTSELLEQNLLIALATLESVQSFTTQLDTDVSSQFDTVRAILDSTASLTARLDALVGENDEAVAQSVSEMQSSIDGLRGIIDTLQASANNVEEVTRLVSDGEGTVGRLLTEDDLYTRVVGIADSVDGITQSAQGFLDATVRIGIELGADTEYLINRGTTRAGFGVRLQPTNPSRYYTVGLTSTPVLRQRTTVTESTTASTTTTTTQRVATDDLRLDLQIAQQWGPVTLRAGAFEGTAGFALDYQPVQWVSVSAEAFDFNAPRGPYLRGVGTVYPFFDPESDNPLRWLYITGGVDDILGSYQLDYFLGAGLRLADPDLRTLIGFIPLN